MASLERVRVGWSGFAGGPGVNTYYFISAATAMAPLKLMCDQMRSKLPSNVTLVIEPQGDIIESTTGQITGSWSATAQAASVGSVGGSYAGPAGIAMTWLTATFLSGRRLKGRTYWVPCTSALYDSDGTLNSIAYSEILESASTFVTSSGSNFIIWQRPRLARAATATLPALAARGGGFGTVSGARVTDKVAVLRSRRD